LEKSYEVEGHGRWRDRREERGEVVLAELTFDELLDIWYAAQCTGNLAYADEVLRVLNTRTREAPPLIHEVPAWVARWTAILGLWAQRKNGGGG